MKTTINQFVQKAKFTATLSLAVIASLQGCNEPQQLITPAATSQAATSADTTAIKAHLASETGSSLTEVQFDQTEQQYIIDNELIVSKKDAEARLMASRAAQRRGSWLLRDDVVKSIRIAIAPNHSAEWRIALSGAIAEWNAIGTKVQFKIVSSGAHITMDFSTKVNDDISWAVREPMPTIEGVFDKNLTTNPNANFYTPNQKKGVLAHALGHMIGLQHTGTSNEWVPSHVGGTNRIDPNSVMMEQYKNWGGFTIDDKRAAEYLYPSNGWEQLPGEGRDVAAAHGGKLWAVGNTPVSGGYSIHYYDVTYKIWKQVPGGGVRIAAGGADKAPWIVNNAGKIFKRRDNGTWQEYPGQATDIGVGRDGEVWIIGKTPVSGGFTIHKWENDKWTLKPGGGVRISVGSDGEPIIVNNVGKIFRFNGKVFYEMPGLAYDVAAGPDLTFYIIGRTPMPSGGYSIHRWQGNLWSQLPGGATNITAFESPKGPVVVNNQLKISEWDI